MKEKNIYFKVGVVLLGILFLLMLVSLFYLPYDPDAMDINAKLQPPSWKHIFGTDQRGRDLFSRVMVGLRDTFFVALGVVGIGGIIGGVIGAISGYFGGTLDEVLMRMNDALTSFPSILLALVMIGILGSGKTNVTISLGIAFIPSFVRLMRGAVMELRGSAYVKSAKLMGVGRFRIIFVHILPNIFATWISGVAVGFNNAVLAESGLSFLGIGVRPPDASLGEMLSEAQGYMFSAPWYVCMPGIVLICLILGFGFVSENSVS